MEINDAKKKRTKKRKVFVSQVPKLSTFSVDDAYKIIATLPTTALALLEPTLADIHTSWELSKGRTEYWIPFNSNNERNAQYLIEDVLGHANRQSYTHSDSTTGKKYLILFLADRDMARLAEFHKLLKEHLSSNGIAQVPFEAFPVDRSFGFENNTFFVRATNGSFLNVSFSADSVNQKSALLHVMELLVAAKVQKNINPLNAQTLTAELRKQGFEDSRLVSRSFISSTIANIRKRLERSSMKGIVSIDMNQNGYFIRINS